MTGGRRILLAAATLVAALVGVAAVLFVNARWEHAEYAPAPANEANSDLAQRHLDLLFDGALSGLTLDGLRQHKSAHSSDLLMLAALEGPLPSALELAEADDESATKLSWAVAAFPETMVDADRRHRYATDLLAESRVEAIVFVFENGTSYLFMTDF